MNKEYRSYLIHISLFVVTFFTTTLAGGSWIHGRIWPFTPYDWPDFIDGLHFSIPFLLILTVHEFGHYFTARYHKIRTSFPYYIPLPPVPLSIGTMGAVIRIKEYVKSQKQNFDIGLSGPLAGFIIAVGVLFYGFTNLPSKDHIFDLHPEYLALGDNYEQIVYEMDTFVLKADVERLTQRDMSTYPDTIKFNNASQEGLGVIIGENLLFTFFKKYVADQSKVPNDHELMHYPLLFAGFLALLFTALNLLPIGQLDGGHVLYGLIGSKWHRKVAMVIFLLFVSYAGLGIVTPFDSSDTLWFGVSLPIGIGLYLIFLYFLLKGLKFNPTTTLMVVLIVFTIQFVTPLFFVEVKGYSGWLFFAFIISRFLGVYHPKTAIEEPLDTKRKILGWIALVIFIISFSPAPLILQ